MPFYEFRCPTGHTTERLLPMSSQSRTTDCKDCGEEATRVISAPAVGSVDKRKAQLVEATQKSAYEPAVVNSVPRAGNRRATPVSHNPQHAKLPKP
ncbi:FmdB family zinc ribbon protein [Corynebacterium gottingense]|uniref:Zinc ribbon domain-containing protein n=1 Tax=Corynebacterium gottingense TaxID=2041036 RepID=A0ABX9UKR2_9CORY|nr:zinc ribbon domain-containing protein [Corynebacterium gottingense]RMD20047.1 zinc ribbon domain-containing protein [Corynebacterium gottingense]